MEIPRDPLVRSARPGRTTSASRMPCQLRRGSSGGFLALDRHAKPGSRMRGIVPYREVLQAAVVPESYRVRPPVKPDLEIGPHRMFAQKTQQAGALGFRQ